jgi:ATP-binding cassette subfamily B protein
MSSRPDRHFERKHASAAIYYRLIAEARPFWPHLAGYVLLSLLATPLALLLPLPLKLAVDSIVGSHPPPAWLNGLLRSGWTSPQAAVWVVAGLVVLFTGMTLTQQAAVALLKTYLGERLVMNFRERLFRHAQRLSLAYHDSAGSADSVYRIQYDATSVQALVVESIVPLIGAVFMLSSMIYVTARLNLKLAVVAMVVCPPLMFLTAAFRPRLRKQWREAKALESSTQSVVQEVLGSVRVVKAFGREEHEQSRFRTHYSLSLAARIKAGLQENCYTILTGLVVAVGTAAVMFVGVRDVLAGDLLLGNLLLIMAYLKQLYDPLKTIGKQFASKEKAMASAERAFALLDELPEVPERPGARAIAKATGAVSFRHVSFAYGRSGEANPVLRGVSFDVPAGARVGIFGRTGAGKTTLMNLLTRFYDPTAGQILLDGVDLRDFRLADLRNQFSIVLQEPVLFSSSIAENIAYARPGASDDEVVAAAKAAGAHEFIAASPEGYDTCVGERGMRLSGGERQRIALARAFLKDAPILILDEPTSSVDNATEAAIVDAMRRLMNHRTTFMIAHRLSTLDSCDMLLAVENGAVRVAARDELVFARHRGDEREALHVPA